jgi:hypothetical protein
MYQAKLLKNSMGKIREQPWYIYIYIYIYITSNVYTLIDPLGDRHSLKAIWSKINMSYILSLKTPIGKNRQYDSFSQKNHVVKTWGDSLEKPDGKNLK